MATYYARNVTGNWAANTSWDSASSGGAGPAGPPIAGDTAIFDSGFTGNITVAASAACAVITVQAGATGTLTYASGQYLTTTSNITFVTGFHLAGTGIHVMNGTIALTTGGLSIPNINISGTSTITLGSDLAITGYLQLGGQLTMAGAYSITCDELRCNSTGAWTHSFVSGQTLTVTSTLTLVKGSIYDLTIKSATASSATNLVYNGAAASCVVSRTMFTDVAYSGSTVTALDNWYGGTLTRTTGITNRTSADIGGGTGGVTGRCLQLGVGVC